MCVSVCIMHLIKMVIKSIKYQYKNTVIQIIMQKIHIHTYMYINLFPFYSILFMGEMWHGYVHKYYLSSTPVV